MTRLSVAPFLSIACVAAVAAVTLPGCGKPEYCAKKTDFNSSVTTLTSVSLTPPDPTEISTDITWHGDRAAHFVNTMMSQGAVLVADTGLVRMRCKE